MEHIDSILPHLLQAQSMFLNAMTPLRSLLDQHIWVSAAVVFLLICIFFTIMRVALNKLLKLIGFLGFCLSIYSGSYTFGKIFALFQPFIQKLF